MKEKPDLLTESATPPYLFGDFHTAHSPFVEPLKQLGKISQTNHSILLVGESGCGKEVLAEAIHQKSPRGHQAFIAVNCAGIPGRLLESELFGYERGAFTGADGKKPGRFVLADGGTLFLDEIAEMPKSLQPKLLRALETKRIQPLGGTKSILTDFRLICATNRDLEAMVERGAFRTDLYHRIQGFTLRIPPLRERREDIPVLGVYFLRRATETYGKRIVGISPGVWSQFCAHDWPGNGRELERVIEHAVVLCEGDFVDWQHLPEKYQQAQPQKPTLKALLEPVTLAVERQIILAELQQNDWNQTRTAKVLGIDPKTLWRKMKAHAIKAPSAATCADDANRSN
jgi:transcriptional regulator with PAS, ATPase and Fis domain